LSDNVLSLWNRFRGDRGMAVYVVRDFSYLNALEAKNINLTRERLAELEKTIASFLYNDSLGKDSLILVSSTAIRNFEFPESGKQWNEFEKKGRHVIFRNPSLMGMTLAKGPRAENFCGIFDENEVMGRLFFTPEDKNFSKTLMEIF